MTESVEWKETLLGEVVEILDSKRIPVNQKEREKRIQGKSQKELYPYYGANGQVGWIDDFLFDEKLILLAEDGGFFEDISKPIAYIVDHKCWVNNHAHVLRAKDVILPEFLMFTLNSANVMPFVSGTTRLKLNQTQMRKIPISLPPLEIQKQIIDRLIFTSSRTKTAKQELSRIPGLTRRLRMAILSKAFRGELVKDSTFSQSCRYMSLSEVCERIQTVNPRKEPDIPFNYVEISSLDSKQKIKFQTLLGKDAPSRARQKIQTGDILFSSVRTYLKRISIVPKNLDGAICSTGFIVLRPSAIIHPKYLFRYVTTDEFVDCVTPLQTGTMYPAVKTNDVLNQQVPVPSRKDQESIVNTLEKLLSQIDLLLDVSDNTNLLLSHLEQSVLKNAFSGRILPESVID